MEMLQNAVLVVRTEPGTLERQEQFCFRRHSTITARPNSDLQEQRAPLYFHQDAGQEERIY
jgi:hypothetical protein